jgi:hypothetical protein
MHMGFSTFREKRELIYFTSGNLPTVPESAHLPAQFGIAGFDRDYWSGNYGTAL